MVINGKDLERAANKDPSYATTPDAIYNLLDPTFLSTRLKLH